MSTPLRERPDAPLGTLIFRAGLLPAEVIESALQESSRTGKRLGEILLERNLLQEAELSRLLAGQKGLPFVTLRERGVDTEAAKLFTEDQARLYRALPFQLDSGAPVVAISDPTNDVVMRNIREALDGTDVQFAVATKSELTELMSEIYNPNGNGNGYHGPSANAAAPAAVVEPRPPAEPEAIAVEPEAIAVEPAAVPRVDIEVVAEPPREPEVEAFAEPLLQPELASQNVPEPEPEPAAVVEPEPVAEVVAEPKPLIPEPAVAEPAAPELPQPEPALQGAPAPAPAPAQAPDPTPTPRPAAPDPPPLRIAPPVDPAPTHDAPPIHELESPVGSATVRVVIRLSNNDRIEAALAGDPRAAKAQAKALIRYIAGKDDGDWPYIGGRFLRPDAIVSIDLVEQTPGDTTSPG